MADLIIKPNSATGDKLILQDRAGGAVLTTASSGATIANIDSVTATSVTAASIKLTPGSTPGSPAEGQIYYNSTTNVVSIYNGNAFEQLNPTAPGGIITTYVSGGNTYVVHKFLITGIFTPLTAITAEWLIVAGGGGSGYGQISAEAGSGGGAGGYRTGTTMTFTANENYIMTVGLGGQGADHRVTGGEAAGRGTNSSIMGPDIFPVVSDGGGGGVKYEQSGNDGGSGSGGSDGGSRTGGRKFIIEQMNGSGSKAHGETTSAQGSDGGASNINNSSGGGGGASAAGQAAQSGAGGYGGAGTANDIVLKGTNVTYAGGGGGGHTSTGGAGGAGGGGAGAGGSGWGDTGQENTGGGAGGPWTQSAERMGSQGGSGIVVIRYTI